MISQTSEYAVRACLELTRRYDEGPVRVEDIAGALDVPQNYLAKILHALGRGEIVVSTRGPGGGFELAVSPERVPLSRIVRVFDPELLRKEGRCILGQGRCTDRTACTAHDRWKVVNEAMKHFFRTTTLRDLSPETEAGAEPPESPVPESPKPASDHPAKR